MFPGTECALRTVPKDSISRLVPLHGHLSFGLGSISVPGVSKWNVGDARKIPHINILELRAICPSLSIHEDFTRQDNGCVLGQYHSPGLCGQGRGHLLSVAQSRGTDNFGVSRGWLCQDAHTVCFSRLPQMISVDFHGMDPSSRCLQPFVETVGLSSGGSVSYKPQLKATNLHLPISRSQCYCDMHSCTTRNTRICMPSHSLLRYRWCSTSFSWVGTPSSSW